MYWDIPTDSIFVRYKVEVMNRVGFFSDRKGAKIGKTRQKSRVLTCQIQRANVGRTATVVALKNNMQWMTVRFEGTGASAATANIPIVQLKYLEGQEALPSPPSPPSPPPSSPSEDEGSPPQKSSLLTYAPFSPKILMGDSTRRVRKQATTYTYAEFPTNFKKRKLTAEENQKEVIVIISIKLGLFFHHCTIISIFSLL